MMQGWVLHASSIEQDPMISAERVSDGYIRQEALKQGFKERTNDVR